MQFNALMDSVNRNAIEDRLTRIYDTNLAAQGSPKEIKAATRQLHKAAGHKDPAAGDGKKLISDLNTGKKRK